MSIFERLAQEACIPNLGSTIVDVHRWFKMHPGKLLYHVL